MNKFYVSILLAAAAFSATAAQPCADVRAANARQAVALKAAPEVDKIVGDYTIQYYDLTIITTSLYTNETTIAAGSSEGQVVLTIPFVNYGIPYTIDVKGTYTPADGHLTFTSKGQVFFGSDLTFYLYDEATQKENVVPSIYGTWNGNGFSFDPNFTIGLPSEGGIFYFKAGYLSLTEYSGEPSGDDPMEGWTTIGTGLMEDGWVMPAFKDMDQSQYIYHVEIQSKDDQHGVYRVVDPYGPETPLAAVNESTAEHGFIQFNVSDPDHVYFYGTDAGFANSTMGITKFYPNNILGYLIGTYPEYTVEELIKKFEGEKQFLSSSFKDGVVLVPSVDTGAGYNNDANFGVQGAQFAGNGWSSGGKPKNMEARIFMPEAGVETVSAAHGGTVRYFNLQGVEIPNPTPGSVYIRVQGTQAAKVRL